MSYMSLSLSYLVIICVISVVSLVLTALFLKRENHVLGILTVLIGVGGVLATQYVGVKYGRHGLSIFFGKAIQPGHLENRDPSMFKNIINDK